MNRLPFFAQDGVGLPQNLWNCLGHVAQVVRGLIVHPPNLQSLQTCWARDVRVDVDVIEDLSSACG